MLTSRLISFLLFFITFGLVVASPTPDVSKRDNADIQAVLTTLQTSTSTILPEIDSLVSAGTATFDTVSPLTAELTTAFDTASAALAALNVAGRDVAVVKRQSDEDIANLVAEILTDVANTLDGILTVPGVAALLPGLDASLNQVLKGLETLLAGVLNLVAQLLVDVARLLRALAFGLTLASLGL